MLCGRKIHRFIRNKYVKFSFGIFSCIFLYIVFFVLPYHDSNKESEPNEILKMWWQRHYETWIVRNFSVVPKEVGFEQRSLPPFSVRSRPDYKWIISFFPNGDANRTKNYVGLFLHLVSKTLEPVFTRCTLSIRDSSNRVLNALSFEHMFTDQARNYGYARFLHRSILLSSVSSDQVVLINADVSIRSEGPYSEYEAERDRCISRTKLIEDLADLRENGILTDIVIRTKHNQEIKVHRAILTARSPVLAKELEKESDTLTIDFETQIVKTLLTYLYTGEVHDIYHDNDAISLLKAAHMYQVHDLKEYCSDFLDEIIDLRNVAKILVLADSYDAFELKSSAIKYISDNFKRFMKEKWHSVIEKEKPELFSELLSHVSDL